MADSIIRDGTGDNYQAKVNEKHQLNTFSVTEDELTFHSFLAETYNFNTGNLTLTSGGASGVWYFMNNEEYPVMITSLFYNLGLNTGGSGNTLIQVIRNPTGGTVISDASSSAPVNRNFSSAKTLNAYSYLGAEGKTLTGGTNIIQSLLPIAAGRHVLSPVALILERGNSVGVKITPPTSTTSMTVQVAASIHRVIIGAT